MSLNNDLKLLVAMDLTQMDGILLRYVSYLCEVWNVQQVYFVHNIKQSDLSSLYEDFFDEDITIESIVKKELERSIKDNYTGGAPHELLITSDEYTESILTHLTKKLNIDLVIAGHKDELRGTGGVAQKLVRMVSALVLLVPEETKNQMNKILVPTDFSAASADSIKVAQRLTEKSKGEIQALNIYSIPSIFFPYINTDRAMDKTKQHIQSKISQFRKKHKFSDEIKFDYIHSPENAVVEVIEKYAEKGEFDLIVVSARGANTITKLFIGSITNDLLIQNRKMPLLVVK